MNYEVTYLTVYGRFGLPCRTLAEAKQEAAKLKLLNRMPGNMALGIKIEKVKK
jgi:hypothetical protein